MEGKRFIHNLTLKNILSYGSEGVSIDLQPLNVLIGTNASGKSNLIEALGLLQAAPANLLEPFVRGGGVKQWIWQGLTPSGNKAEAAELGAEVEVNQQLLRYELAFFEANTDLYVAKELVANASRATADDFYYYNDGKQALINNPAKSNGHSKKRSLDSLDKSASILSQQKDAFFYPEITSLGESFLQIRIYRRWNFEPGKPPRTPEPSNLPKSFLTENNSNLIAVLETLLARASTKKPLMKRLQALYPRAKGLKIATYAASRELFLEEYDLSEPIAAARLSEGTLRYLSLLAILLHPTPPPLICLEEPELGIHPDLLSNLAELLIEASKRTQLIITTQSDMLLSAFSQIPGSVIVCDKDEKGSHLNRLDLEQVEEWRAEGETLGGMWARGVLGGARW